jgi:hypothetical protein
MSLANSRAARIHAATDARATQAKNIGAGQRCHANSARSRFPRFFPSNKYSVK